KDTRDRDYLCPGRASARHRPNLHRDHPMSYSTLLYEVADGIARVTINRPDKLNALNRDVVAELGDVALRLETDDTVRGAILTGAGPKAFVAGADISEIAGQGPIDGRE